MVQHGQRGEIGITSGEVDSEASKSPQPARCVIGHGCELEITGGGFTFNQGDNDSPSALFPLHFFSLHPEFIAERRQDPSCITNPRYRSICLLNSVPRGLAIPCPSCTELPQAVCCAYFRPSMRLSASGLVNARCHERDVNERAHNAQRLSLLKSTGQ